MRTFWSLAFFYLYQKPQNTILFCSLQVRNSNLLCKEKGPEEGGPFFDICGPFNLHIQIECFVRFLLECTSSASLCI